MEKKYHELIEEYRNRELTEGRLEKHHIVPKCMGGDDDPDNLVMVTIEEHYDLHVMLADMHPEKHELVGAINAIYKRANREPPSKKALSKAAIERWKCPEYRKKQVESFDPVKHSNAMKKALDNDSERMRKSKASKKLWENDEYRNKVRAGQLAALNDPEIKEKHAKASKASWTPERKKAQAERMKRLWAERNAGK